MRGYAYRLKSPVPKLTENDIEKAASAYWCAHGWTVIRQHVGTYRLLGPGKRFIKMGTKGMADYLVIKPTRFGKGLMVYVELKRPGEEPDDNQQTWMRHQRQLGFEAAWFDSIPAMAEWFDRTFGMRHDGRPLLPPGASD